MKTLLILCGSMEAVEAVKSAKKMGLYVIICDKDINAPAKEYADDFICASIYHPQEIIESLEKYPDKERIDGVITVAADNPHAVSLVASYLGLESLSHITAIYATDKLKMKSILKKSGLDLPWYKEIVSLEDLKQTINSRCGEYVLKPTDSRGSRGVIRINDLSQCDKAYSHSLNYSNNNVLILEEWIDGDQLSSESIVMKKRAYLCGLADRNYDKLDELYPFVIEDGGETPSKYSSEKIETQINKLMTRICEVIDLDQGSIKGDLVISGDKLYVIEFAVRLSGGSFSTYTIPNVYDYNLIENVILLSFGEKASLPPSPLKHKKYQANRFLFISAGQIQEISGLPTNDENIIDFNLNIKVGDSVENIKDHTMRAGTVLTVGNSRSDAIDLANQVISDLKVKII